LARNFLYGFRKKPTIRLAPDCLVYINNSDRAPVCPMCAGVQEFRNDITAVNVNLSVDGAPGTASISFAIPRYKYSSYLDESNQLIFKAMQEVKIFMKGRFLLSGEPYYYPVFWGMITSVSQSASSEVWTVTLHCHDILKWWEFTVLNLNPSVIDLEFQNYEVNVMKHYFANFNPYEIIMALALIGFGDMIGPQNLSFADAPEFVRQIIAEQTKDAFVQGLMRYWANRFQEISSRLKIFGVNGFRMNRSVRNIDPQQFAREFWSQIGAGRRTNIPLPGLEYEDDDFFANFHYEEFIGGGPALVESQSETKLNIAKQQAAAIGYEFYMDTNGDIIFKPPFYNMDVRGQPVYTIGEEELFSFEPIFDSDRILTRIDITGRFTNLYEADTSQAGVYAYYVDRDLLRQYGYRTHEDTLGFLRTSRSCFSYAVSMLDRENAHASSAAAVIPGRPELRLGRPVYVPTRRSFYYITGINHSFGFGGSFRTSLTLTAERPLYRGWDGSAMNPLPNRVMLFDATPPDPDPRLEQQRQRQLESDRQAERESELQVAQTKARNDQERLSQAEEQLGQIQASNRSGSTGQLVRQVEAAGYPLDDFALIDPETEGADIAAELDITEEQVTALVEAATREQEASQEFTDASTAFDESRAALDSAYEAVDNGTSSSSSTPYQNQEFRQEVREGGRGVRDITRLNESMEPYYPPEDVIAQMADAAYGNVPSGTSNPGEVDPLPQGNWVEVDWDPANGPLPTASTETIVPVSDEDGFKHIGGFPYGARTTIASLDREPGEREQQSTVVEQYGLESGIGTEGQGRVSDDIPAIPPKKMLDRDALSSAFDNLTLQRNGGLPPISLDPRASEGSNDCSCSSESFTEQFFRDYMEVRRGNVQASAQDAATATRYQDALEELDIQYSTGLSEEQIQAVVEQSGLDEDVVRRMAGIEG